MLVGDDSVWLEKDGGRLLASPHPNTRGLLEVRGVGLVEMPVAERVPVALLLRLDPEAPRLIEGANAEAILGIEIPVLALWPDSPVLHLRAELALERFGLN